MRFPCQRQSWCPANALERCSRIKRKLRRRWTVKLQLEFAERMLVGDQPLEPVIEHVGVDLRRRYVGVAEHLLQATEIGAVGEQMRGERVAQHVRRNPRRRN